jgi:hypothetical protein
LTPPSFPFSPCPLASSRTSFLFIGYWFGFFT